MRKLLPVLLLTACPEPEPEEEWEKASFSDQGIVCWDASAGQIDLQVVLQGACMSSSCSRGFTSSCDATADGTTLTLTSEMSWENNVTPGVDCTADCGIPMAECALSGVVDGTYTLDFDGESYTIDVPGSSASTSCYW